MAAPIGPYTPVVRAGDWIIVSGQLGLHEGSIVAGGVQAQTAQAIANLKSQLASVGASLGDVVKTLCFLTDLDTFATFNEAYVMHARAMKRANCSSSTPDYDASRPRSSLRPPCGDG
ncbi:MAG: RidA family protein [Acidimicrobiia bacterium]|nr:RidA family protein [Acidimicrobiia bacterium]